MDDYLQSILLGVVEGLTEFLPVSSTAHLRITQALMGMNLENAYWKMFAVVIQLGAIAALPVYFWGKISRFLTTFPRGEQGDRTPLTHPLGLVMIAFVVTAIPAFLLKKIIDKNLESLYVIGGALVVGGIVMWVVDVLCRQPRVEQIEKVSLPQAVGIGAAQILSALFPGVSRSMSTIAAGQLAGLSRAVALEFSFFLSMPTMAAATGYDLLKTLRPGKDLNGVPLPRLHLSGHEWVLLAIGFAVSFIVALGVIAWFMAWVRRRGFVPFAIYRIVAGTAVLLWAARLMK